MKQHSNKIIFRNVYDLWRLQKILLYNYKEWLIEFEKKTNTIYKQFCKIVLHIHTDNLFLNDIHTNRVINYFTVFFV